MGWFAWALSQAGDPAPPGPEIQNDTAVIVYVFTVEPDGTEISRSFVQPGESRTLFGNCTGEFLARDEGGRLLGHRGPFETCNLDTWIIELPP